MKNKYINRKEVSGMSNKIKVTIMGNSYNLNTETDESKIRVIEEALNTQLQDIRDLHPTLSAVDTLTIAALNIMDYTAGNEASMDIMREEITQYLDDAAKARMEVDELRRELSMLRKENIALKRELDNPQLSL